ncbi:hypothetical protein IWX90DRAFT_62879 [Phyllosticta citrichinensis]|uniref:Uncharacterized protein n=1 Tax=Phyllosticta citrichinensis TaxID=1130410 RepID=A0ABR1XH64_9PEZI
MPDAGGLSVSFVPLCVGISVCCCALVCRLTYPLVDFSVPSSLLLCLLHWVGCGDLAALDGVALVVTACCAADPGVTLLAISACYYLLATS